MIVYKCNGIRYSDGKECTSVSNYDAPSNWLTIDGSIENKLMDARCVEANIALHFCCRSCFENYFFMNKEPQEFMYSLYMALKNMVFIAKKYASDDAAEDQSTEHAESMIKKFDTIYPNKSQS